MQRLLLSVVAALLVSCAHAPVTPSWTYRDFKEVTFDPFQGMDGNVTLTPQELKGRVIWNLWSGDNAGFWNYLVQHGFGTADLLKMIVSPRDHRFQTYGVINQPGYVAGPPDAYGLTVDVPRDASASFDDRIDVRTYGRSSGIMGLRLFPNPKFDPSKWDAKRYFADVNYFTDPKLERPYLVGMACSFCHLGPDPTNPPADPNEPTYANLSDYVGQHTMKVWEVFAHELPNDNFVKQLLMSNPPGTLDTSFIATDYLNNPGTMNGIYMIGSRVKQPPSSPEHLKGDTLCLHNLAVDANGDQLTPRVLKDGADSVGILNALARVYINIGEYWEEWTRHFNPLVGVKRQSPIRVCDAQTSSPHWNWSESHMPDLAAYFVRVTKPHHLKDAPGGSKYLTSDAHLLDRGKRVFADNCAVCHSSKQPDARVNPRSAEGKRFYEQSVLAPDFLDDNFLGSEVRYPVTLIGTNATRAVASNALRGHIWDNFSSETYKTLQAVGTIDVYDPFTKTTRPWTVPGGGRGYYRPPSLVSLWTSAPFLHDNALGKPLEGVSVDARMDAFNDAIAKLLWPEKRAGAASIRRTSEESWLQLPNSYLDSPIVRWLLRNRMHTDPTSGAKLFAFGPIPKGTPVNLLANTDLELNGVTKAWRLGRLLLKTADALKTVRTENLTGDAATAELMKLVPALYALNACPDFIHDKGHMFGTEISDDDKLALIEFLKTL